MSAGPPAKPSPAAFFVARRPRETQTLLRANPSKDGDAELRGYGDLESSRQPGRQRTDHESTLAATFF